MRRTLVGVGLLVLAVAAAPTAAAQPAAASGPGVTAASGDPGAIPATNPQHFINFTFPLPSALDDYRYSVAVNTPLSEDSIYYAHYVYGQAGGGGFYSGIQPHPNGKAGVRFSYFGEGATPIGPTCHGDADGGSGVTCGLDDVAYVPGRTYTIDARKTVSSPLTYVGTITDTVTGVARTIGSWQLPATVTGFSGTGDTFIEKFSGVTSCADIPAVSVTYSGATANGSPVVYPPQSQTADYTPGTGIYTCGDVSSYATKPVAGGYTLTSTVAATPAAKTAQQIAFTSTPPASAVPGVAYPLAATGGASGQPVTFATTTPTVCTVTGASVTLAKAGACTVTANQAGNASYTAAPQVTQTYTAAATQQADLQLTLTPATSLANGNLPITVTVRNNGPADSGAYRTQVVTTAPVNNTGGGTASPYGATWTGSNLAAGASTTYTLTTNPPAGLALVGGLTSGTTPDPNLFNNFGVNFRNITR